MILTYIYYFSYIIVVPGILFALWAQFRVKSTYKKYSGIFPSSGWNGCEMSQMLLEKYDCLGVSVQRTGGKLTDNYNPSTDILSLSEDVYNGTSIADLGIAAHECGHAVQKQKGYLPFKLRNILVPITNIGSRLAIPLAIIGVVIEWFSKSGGNIGTIILELGIILYSLTTIFSLVTLPVEINASRRACNMLSETGVLSGDELKGARSVLYAAALTYVASLLVSFLYLLRFFMIISQFRKRN